MIGVLMLRVIHFIGLENLFHLMVGTYHRPVRERKVLLFLDINGSTALGERLGALSMRALVRKFFSDLSPPITDHDGDIYLYKGDGLIAIWNWKAATDQESILRAVDAMFSAIERRRAVYDKLFGIVPSFRIGIHGGDVIVSEQGDTKRSIGIYGDAINIAARMEEVARVHNVRCIVSDAVAAAIADRERLREIGKEAVKGISAPIRVYEYRPLIDGSPHRRSVRVVASANSEQISTACPSGGHDCCGSSTSLWGSRQPLPLFTQLRTFRCTAANRRRVMY